MKWLDPNELKATARALSQQAITPEQGQMVSGRYVGPNAITAIAQVLKGKLAGDLNRRANEESMAQSTALTRALSGDASMGPQQPLEQRLGSLQFPQAQQMAQQLALRRAEAENAPQPRLVKGEEIGAPSGSVFQFMPGEGYKELFAPKGTDLPSSVQEYQFAQKQGFGGSYQDWVNAKASASRPSTTVNVGGGRTIDVGKIPQGFQLEYDAQGRPFRMSPIAGSDPDLERQQQAQKAEMRKEQEQETANLMTQDIARAKTLVQESPYLTAGFFGNLMKDWAGTPAADLKALSETIGANIGFDYLNQMRQSSPTGGALGNVTERELALLKATAGNIEQSQSPAQLLQNLNRLENQFNEVVHGKNKSASTNNLGSKNNQSPQGVDPQVWQFMTPEERALFQ